MERTQNRVQLADSSSTAADFAGSRFLLFQGDVEDSLRKLPPKQIFNLIVTSPPYNEEGKLKNDLAKKRLRYNSESNSVGSPGVYLHNGVTRLVYHVRMDDGKVLLLSEDCLAPLRDFH